MQKPWTRLSRVGLTVLLLSCASATWGMRWEAKSSWTTVGQAWTATGPGPLWDLLLSKTKEQDGSFCAVMRITQAADQNVTNPGGDTDETAPGYEAGLVFRHTGNKFYRVCLSTLYKEVALWRTDGGWLAVHDVPLVADTDYRLRVDFSGARIKVFVDEKEVLDVTDARPLLGKGKVGLAVKQGKTTFSGMECNSVSPLGVGSAAANFTYRKWHGQDWFFNGLEPVARLDPDLNLHSKLAACFRTIGCFSACWIHYSDAYANRNAKFTVQESGPRLKCLLEGIGPHEEIASQYLMTLSLDAAAKSYVYDFDAAFTVREGKTWTGLEFTDYWPDRVVGPAVQQPDAWPHYYGWIVWQAKDGKTYKHPINHNGYYPGFSFSGDYLKIATNGGLVGFFNEEVNPVWRIVKAQDDVSHGLCAWGHDLHLAYATPKEYPLKAGTRYSLQYQLTGYDRARGEEFMKTATFPPDARNLDWEYPFYQAGVNDFQSGVVMASPFQVQLWHKGGGWAGSEPPDFWDRTVGRKDKASLRVDGPYSIVAGIGPSWFMPAFSAKRYLISAMVKTENVRGEGPFISFACLHNKAAKDSFVTGITGTRDWTRIGFVTTNLTGLIQGDLRVGLSGTGKAWFDNVEIRALKDEEAVTLPPWEQVQPAPPVPDTLIWLKINDRTGTGAFDYSNRGHSAELRGLKWVEDETKGTCLEFDGKGAAIIEYRDDLLFKMPLSVTCWVKPAEKAPVGWHGIFGQYNFLWFWLMLDNPKGPYRIGFQMNQKGTLATDAIVPVGVWSHLAVTHDKKIARIYLNGVKVLEKELLQDQVLPSGSPVCLGGFYGFASNGGNFSGRLSEARFLTKALSDAEVRNEYASGQPAKQERPSGLAGKREGE